MTGGARFENLFYWLGKLSEESGEVARELCHQYKDEDGFYNERDFKDRLRGELGDVMFCVAEIANMAGVDIDAAAFLTLRKVKQREEGGK